MRKALMGAWVVSLVSLAAAQHLEVAVDGGYGLGVGTAFVGANYTIEQQGTNNVYTNYEEVYASGGEGLKMTGEIAYFFNNNIGVIASSGYSMLGGYSTETKSPMDTNYRTTTSRYLPVNIGVKIRAKMGILEPYIYLAPGVYFPQKESESIEIQVLPYPPPPVTRDTIKKTFHYAPGWGVSAGIGAVLRVSEKVGIRLEITPTYAFARQTSYVQEGGGAPGTYYYRDTPSLGGSGFDLVEAPRDSYCSAAVKAGVCLRVF
jgi:hypothetical protein